ncbi:hypothetical protein GJAV_G00253750 [Gymnothorax javanicus]|nr:hypothetical protein GJAV_G00253750 [Gymnothorax javanicus]
MFQICTTKFLGLTAVMMDVIPIISTLNLFFQKTEIDIGAIKEKIDDCLQSLMSQKAGGDHFNKFQSELQVNLEGKTTYHGHEVAACPLSDIKSTVSKFIDNLHANISTRFPDTDLLSAFGVMRLRPITFVKEDEIEDWGNTDFDLLLSHYGKEAVHSWKTAEGEKVEAQAEPFVDAAEARKEWHHLKKNS